MTHELTKSLRLIISVLCFLSLTTFASAQQDITNLKVSINESNVSVKRILEKVEKTYQLRFFYDEKIINVNESKSISIENASIKDFIDALFDKTVNYSISENGLITLTKNPVQPAEADGKIWVKGVVTDDNNQPLAGVAIYSPDKKVVTTTDFDGNYSIADMPKNTKLVFNFIGMKDQEFLIASAGTLNVMLEEDALQLEEVVVTGYGTYKKSAYAGSASIVKTSEMKDVPATSFAQLLQGSAPGIQVSSSSGQPGSTTTINIRGMGSFNASNSPLYVIDGVPVLSGSINSMSSDGGLDIMSTINTNDIENITIIKDAAAASLYGSRAANGVVVISTKRGKKGKPAFSYKSDWGFSDFAMKYRPIMDGQTRRDALYEGLIAEGMVQEGMTEAEAKQYADDNIDTYAPVPWCGFVDWEDVLFKKGSHQNYEFSVSGATDNFNYYSSLAYMKQDGIALNSGMNRITGRLNVDYKANKWLTFGAKILYANVDQDVNAEGTTYTSPFYSSKSAVVPSDAVYNEDGTWNRELIRIGDRNPRLSAEYDYQREYVNRAFSTIYGEAAILKNLKFKTTLSYDFNSVKGKEWSDPRTSNGDDTNGSMTTKFYEYKKLVWTNSLNYNVTIADRHNIDALAGYEMEDYKRYYLSGTATNFATYEKNDISNGMKTESVSGNQARYRLMSYIVRLNYNFDNKYYIGGSWRTDGSSRLAPENRWGNFWSVSAAWRINREEFMSSADWLSDLKLRASYGVNGTLPSDYYGYYGLSSLTNGYMEQPGIIQSQLENYNLTWETNHNFNVGLDFGINDRVNFVLEYYTRTTNDLLMDKPISMTTGFSSYLMNIGKVKNEGVEFEINSINFNRKNFYWNTSFTIGHNRNKILTLDGQQTEIIDGAQIRKVGMPYRTFYVIEFAGINPETGMPQFYTNDLDKDGKYIKDITEDASKANYIPYKNAYPVVSGGLSNSLRYRWFDLNFMVSYQFGGYSYDNWAQKTEHSGEDPEANIPIYYENRWRQPGDNATYERIIANNDVSMASYRNSRRIHSTDFIRLKNLTFGITIPQQWTKRIKIDQFRLYFSANNLLTWAKHDYYDPEAVSGGTAIWGTPPLKTLTFGLNINF